MEYTKYEHINIKTNMWNAWLEARGKRSVTKHSLCNVH